MLEKIEPNNNNNIRFWNNKSFRFILESVNFLKIRTIRSIYNNMITHLYFYNTNCIMLL